MKNSPLDMWVPAYIQTKKILFNNINITKWAFFFIIVALSGFSFGLNLNSMPKKISPAQGMESYANFITAISEFVDAVGKILNPEHGAVIFGITLTILLIIIIPTISVYLAALGKFMVLDAIMKNNIGWRMFYKKRSAKAYDYSLILLRIVIYSIIFTIILWAFIFGQPKYYGNNGLLFTVIVLISGSLIFLTVTTALNLLNILAAPAFLRTPDGEKAIEIIKKIYNLTKTRKGKAFFTFFLCILLNFAAGAVITLIGSVLIMPANILALTLPQADQPLASAVTVYYVFCYLPVIIAANTICGVYFNSYNLLTFSALFPEYALLLPVRDQTGKIIDTMSYEEHIMRQREYASENSLEDGQNDLFYDQPQI